jgi:hypothetical protein
MTVGMVNCEPLKMACGIMGRSAEIMEVESMQGQEWGNAGLPASSSTTQAKNSITQGSGILTIPIGFAPIAS